jgi:hypothetical protein
VWYTGNKKLLSSNLWINYDRMSYKPVVPNRKNGGCTIAFRSDTGGLVSRVFVDGPNRRITKAFHTSNCCKLDAMIARTHDSRPLSPTIRGGAFYNFPPELHSFTSRICHFTNDKRN